MDASIRSWQEAREYLGKKDDRPGGNNTRIRARDDGALSVVLHGTAVVVYTPPEHGAHVLLWTGGYRTHTTKDRINCHIPGGFHVIQDRGEWYLTRGGWSTSGPRWVFAEGITISPNGEVSNAGDDSGVRSRAAAARKIRGYVSKYMDALLAGQVPPPDSGDCWYCVMREEKTGKPLGEVTRNTDHLDSHIEESYFVPSLLTAAVERYPASIAARSRVGELWGVGENGELGTMRKMDTGSTFFDDITREQIGSSLRRYMRQQYGIAS